MAGGQRPFRLKFALKVTHPFEKHRFRQISATVRDGEKVQLENVAINDVLPLKADRRDAIAN